MEQHKCVIIEDEPLALERTKGYVEKIPSLELVGSFDNAVEGLAYLQAHAVDILFLDINMPGLSGISFARSLTVSPLIIFTTAYPEFAVEGFDLNALDYLVKPFAFERFLKAVNRAFERLTGTGVTEPSTRKVLVKADKKLYAIEFSDIQFIEGQGDYIRVHLNDKRLVVHDTIKNFLVSLPDTDFMRIHKSFVVNLRKVTFIEGNQVRVGEHTLNVSPTYREALLNRYAGLSSGSQL